MLAPFEVRTLPFTGGVCSWKLAPRGKGLFALALLFRKAVLRSVQPVEALGRERHWPNSRGMWVARPWLWALLYKELRGWGQARAALRAWDRWGR